MLSNSKKHRFTRLVIKGYFILVLLCFLVLSLPFVQNVNISWFDTLFQSFSIVSTTGLSVTDIGSTYNIWGQMAILLFIQLGGIGYMAIGSLLVLKHRKKLSSVSANLLKLEFSLPSKYPLRHFISTIIFYTIILESIGAFLLYKQFLKEGIENPLWNGIFISISSFCTAGFSLFPNSLMDFGTNWEIMTVVSVLSLLGAIGFIVVSDVSLTMYQKRRKMTLTSKIICLSTFTIVFLSLIMLWLSEHCPENSFSSLMFQIIMAHSTAGFNSVEISGLYSSSIFTLIVLMVIGASPSGTGGGLKTTTATAVYAVLRSALKRSKRVMFFNKEVPLKSIKLSLSSIALYFIFLFFGVWALLLIEKDNFTLMEILYECSSALSTVGMSLGMTNMLSPLSKLVICILMFIGRIGVITIGLSIFNDAELLRKTPQQEEILV